MTAPTMRRVTSSNISAIGYDGQTLFVEFTGSGTYRFENVPPEIDAELRAIEEAGGSVGRYFHYAIRSKFASSKVELAGAEG